MLKQEFEEMIGKEVDYETFKIYEAMYLAAPESVTKQRFVEMLNIKAIPESEDAIERRRKREEYISKIKRDIEELQASIKFEQMDYDNCKRWADEGDLYFKSLLKGKRSYINRLKAEVRAYKMMIA